MKTRNDKRVAGSEVGAAGTDKNALHASAAESANKNTDKSVVSSTALRAGDKIESGRSDSAEDETSRSGAENGDGDPAHSQADNDSATIDQAVTTGGRSSRKRQLPARFRDSALDVQPSPRRRRISTALPDSPLPHAAVGKKSPVKSPVSESEEMLLLPDRSPERPSEIEVAEEESAVIVPDESTADHTDSAAAVTAHVSDTERPTNMETAAAGPDQVGEIRLLSSTGDNVDVDNCSIKAEHSGNEQIQCEIAEEQQSVVEHQQSVVLTTEDRSRLVDISDGQLTDGGQWQIPTSSHHDNMAFADVTGAAGSMAAVSAASNAPYITVVDHCAPDPLAAAAGAFFASDDDDLAVDARQSDHLTSAAVSSIPSSELDDDDDLIAMEVESLDVPLPSNEEPREACKVCHRQMKVSQLRQHMLLHAGLRPFKCEVCQAAFTRRSDVFRHVKIVHHQEKPFKCSLDGKEFGDRKSLKLHMEQHKRPVLFACKVCDFRFGKFDSYVNHIKNIHPTGEPLPSFPEEVEPAPEPLAPPRGRHGPKPLEEFIDDDGGEEIIASHCGGVVMTGSGGGGGDYLDATVIGDRLDMSSAAAAAAVSLENIETEEIPHDSMQQLVVGEDHSAMTGVQHVVADVSSGDAVGGDSFSVVSTANGVSCVTTVANNHMSMPVIDEDAASILGMTDLSMPSADASASVASHSVESRAGGAHYVPSVGRSVSVTSSLRRPAHTARAQPRVVTIGKPVHSQAATGVPAVDQTAASTPAGAGVSSGNGPFKTVLLTRPRMVAGRQVLQAVKLSPGQRIVAARVPPSSGASSGSAASRTASAARAAVANSRSPAISTGSIARPAHVLKTASPVAAPASPRLRPAAAVSQSSQQLTVVEEGSATTGGRSIEVTTSSAAGGSRTIVLQTSGDTAADGDILQSKEAMQSLLSAVQQLVTASGDTLEGKQIEIVMQNDDAPK